MAFLYETHLHSSPASRCGVSPSDSYIEPYKKAGYTGAILTNHFFNGNSGIDRSLPWEERVHLYCEDFYKMAEAAKDKDFDVFFGLEFNFHGDEYLIFGEKITEDWLLKHPEIMTLSHLELFKLIDSEGALMLQAHPYRLRSYMSGIFLHPEAVHGCEVYNAGNQPEENEKALAYAKEHDFIQTAGSDNHNVANFDGLGKTFHPGAVVFEERPKDINDFVRLLKEKKNTVTVL